MTKDVVEVSLRAVVPLEGSYAVFLGNDDKTFVIYVDEQVGTAIAMSMRGMTKERPLTHDLLGHDLHLVHDALPFGNRGRGLHAFELLPEGAGVGIVREARIGPGGAARRQVAGERVEALLHVGLGKILDEAPRRVLVP